MFTTKPPFGVGKLTFLCGYWTLNLECGIMKLLSHGGMLICSNLDSSFDLIISGSHFTFSLSRNLVKFCL